MKIVIRAEKGAVVFDSTQEFLAQIRQVVDSPCPLSPEEKKLLEIDKQALDSEIKAEREALYNEFGYHPESIEGKGVSEMLSSSFTVSTRNKDKLAEIREAHPDFKKREKEIEDKKGLLIHSCFIKTKEERWRQTPVKMEPITLCFELFDLRQILVENETTLNVGALEELKPWISIEVYGLHSRSRHIDPDMDGREDAYSIRKRLASFFEEYFKNIKLDISFIEPQSRPFF